MKRIIFVLGALFILSNAAMNIVFANTADLTFDPHHASVKEKGMRGLWVATVFQLDYPSPTSSDSASSPPSSSALKSEAIAIIENAKHLGFNAIFLQVRPSGDAFYPSKIAKWSRFLTGKKGRAPADGFDPLAFWTEECHKRGIEIHAWLNPYRISTGAGEMSENSIRPGFWNTKTENISIPAFRR